MPSQVVAPGAGLPSHINHRVDPTASNQHIRRMETIRSEKTLEVTYVIMHHMPRLMAHNVSCKLKIMLSLELTFRLLQITIPIRDNITHTRPINPPHSITNLQVGSLSFRLFIIQKLIMYEQLQLIIRQLQVATGTQVRLGSFNL